LRRIGRREIERKIKGQKALKQPKRKNQRQGRATWSHLLYGVQTKKKCRGGKRKKFIFKACYAQGVGRKMKIRNGTGLSKKGAKATFAARNKGAR